MTARSSPLRGEEEWPLCRVHTPDDAGSIPAPATKPELTAWRIGIAIATVAMIAYMLAFAHWLVLVNR